MRDIISKEFISCTFILSQYVDLTLMMNLL